MLKEKKSPGNYTFHTINFSNKDIQISNSLALIRHNYTHHAPHYYKGEAVPKAHIVTTGRLKPHTTPPQGMCLTATLLTTSLCVHHSSETNML